jgi:hypothetical protein
MPEHVHPLLSEPERGKLSLVLQMLKQITSRKLKPLAEPRDQPRFWQVRYYDFPVWSEANRETALHSSQSGGAGVGSSPGGVEVEQLRALCDRRRGRGGNRITVDGAETSAVGSCAEAVVRPTLPQRTREEPALSAVERVGQTRLEKWMKGWASPTVREKHGTHLIFCANDLRLATRPFCRSGNVRITPGLVQRRRRKD